MMVTSHLDHEHGLKYVITVAILDGGNLHPFAFFTLDSYPYNLHPSSESNIDLSRFLQSCMLELRGTFPRFLGGNYYVDLSVDPMREIFAAARVLHSFFLLAHVLFFFSCISRRSLPPSRIKTR
jgi:hypothetical protein